MKEATNDGSKNWDIVMEIVNEHNMSGEDVLRALCDWHGLQLLDHNFTENFIEEYD